MSKDRIRKSVEKYAPAPKESKVEDLVSQFNEFIDSSRKRFSSRFDELTFCPRSVDKAKLPLACMKMFYDLDFLDIIDEEELARFILTVKYAYRTNHYHNWTHAFSTAHFCYVAIKNLDLIRRIGQTNCCILLISALCHDVDHRALTNPYLMEQRGREHGSIVSRASVKESVQERHHYYVTENILNRPGCEVLKGLNACTPKKLAKIKRLLLTTDASMDKFKEHLRIFQDLANNISDGDYHPSLFMANDSLIMDLVISCADLSDQVKDFDNAKEAACLVLKEFYEQGDLETSKGRQVVPLFKRDSPVQGGQIYFFENMLLPLFGIFKKVFPESRRLYRNAQKNLEIWKLDDFKNFQVA